MSLFYNKIISFFFSLLIIIVIAFAVIHLSPGDAAERFVNAGSQDEYTTADPLQQQQQLVVWRKKLGLDLPLFYFSIGPLSAISTDFSTSKYHHQQDWKYWVPVLRYHPDNQFHFWLLGDGIFSKGILRGDLGISYSTRQPVSELLRGRIGWSIGLSLASLLLAFSVSIPLGLRAARQQGKRFDQIIQNISLLLLSLPIFWFAIILLLFFANPAMLNWFPASGITPLSDVPTSWSSKIIATLPYLILPTLCYTAGTMAFLLRSVRDTAVIELKSDYARTALAKGQDVKNVLYKHVLRNMLPTLLTIFSLAFPIAISGAVLIESIFAIPGMGLTIEQAVYAKDYPVISAVFLLSSAITLSGFFICDLLVARLDPRTLNRSAVA